MTKLTPEQINNLLKYDINTGNIYYKHNGELVLKNLSGNGYVQATVLKRRYMLHNLIWCLVYKDWPPCCVRHINGKIADNRLGNLTLVSKNTSGVTGVSFCKLYKKWSAYVHVNRKKVHLGYFDSSQAAIKARKDAEKIYKEPKND